MTQTPDILCMEWLQMIVMMATITVTVITIMFTLSHELCQPWSPGKKCQNIITHSDTAGFWAQTTFLRVSNLVFRSASGIPAAGGASPILLRAARQRERRSPVSTEFNQTSLMSAISYKARVPSLKTHYSRTLPYFR